MKTMQKGISLLVVMMLFCALMVGCSGGNDGGNETAGTVLASTDSKFQFTADESWENLSGSHELNDVAVIEAADKSTERYAVVIAENKADIAMDLEQYTNFIFEQMKSALTDAEAVDPATATINGYNGYKGELTGTISNVNVHYWVDTLENDTYFVQLVGWTLNSKTEENRESINKMLETFKINE